MFRSSLYIRGCKISPKTLASEVRRIVKKYGPHFVVDHGVSSRTQVDYVSIEICDDDDSVRHISLLSDFLNYFFTKCRSSLLLDQQPWASCTLALTASNNHEHKHYVRTIKFEESIVSICAGNQVRIEVEVFPEDDLSTGRGTPE